MYRYVSLLFNPDDPRAAGQAAAATQDIRRVLPGWTVICQIEGCIVAGLIPERGAQLAYVLPGHRGVILGRLFRRASAETPADDAGLIGDRQAQAILDTRGASLVAQYWGNYVAFLHDADSSSQYVIRDCSGHVPCYITKMDAIHVVFSDVADLCRLFRANYSVDWSYVAAFLYFNELQVRSCGLRGVTEILAGDCWQLTAGKEQQRCIWHPTTVVETRIIDRYEEAIPILRDTTQYCVDTWAAVHSRVMHRLSGGFDSAVVLGCLSRSVSRPFVACLNRYTEEAGEDERSFARLAAQRARVQLIEKAWFEDQLQLNLDNLSLPLTPKPEVAILGSMLELGSRNALAEQYDIEAFWTGQGGDHLFCQSTTDLGPADHFHYHRFGDGLRQAIKDASRLTGESYWAVAASMWSAFRSHNPWLPDYIVDRTPLYVNPDSLPSDVQSYIAHPWMSGIERLPKGKQSQIFYLSELLNRQRPVPQLDYADQHHPLISQPLIEVCLQIPIYLHIFGGKQRALARTAFTDRVPHEILRREGKGAMTSYVLAVMRNSRAFVREFLLDGVLVDNQLLNRKSLEPHLNSDRPIKPEQFFPLFACVAAEAWARNWAESKIAVAA
jgi:asparagine synthase (glutamine-hydrolysing)